MSTVGHRQDGLGAAGGPFDARAISRPDPSLLNYYIVISVLSTVAFPFVFLPLYFKYHTLRYRFDDEGVSMAWGILFRRETYLAYRRIQDIHVTRNIIQRWMGLATVGVQTASGTSGPEMSIEGILQADELRNFLYQKMRGAKGTESLTEARPEDEALVLLREIRDSMVAAGRRAAAGERA